MVSENRTLSVQRLAGSVQNPPEKTESHSNGRGLGQRYDPAIRFESLDIAGRHQKNPFAGKADHFRFHAPSVRRLDQTAGAYRRSAANRLEGKADHPAQPAFHHQFRRFAEARAVSSQLRSPRFIEPRCRSEIGHGLSSSLSPPNKRAIVEARRLSTVASMRE